MSDSLKMHSNDDKELMMDVWTLMR
jgi:hypothetical protein